MPVFPSELWCRQAVALAEADPEFGAASAGWKGDFCVVILAEPPQLPKPFAIHLRPEAGKVRELRVLEDLDEVDELQPAYVATAKFADWKALLQGTLDPVEAVLSRQVQIRGDVQPLIARARFKGIIERVLSKLTTTYVDEVGS